MTPCRSFARHTRHFYDASRDGRHKTSHSVCKSDWSHGSHRREGGSSSRRHWNTHDTRHIVHGECTTNSSSKCRYNCRTRWEVGVPKSLKPRRKNIRSRHTDQRKYRGSNRKRRKWRGDLNNV